MKVYPLDLANGTIGTAAELAGNSYSFSFYPGSGYDFYVSDNYAVYGYNLGDTTVTKLMSYVDSDIDVWQINNIIPISDTEFYGSYSSASDWQDYEGRSEGCQGAPGDYPCHGKHRLDGKKPGN